MSTLHDHQQNDAHSSSDGAAPAIPDTQHPIGEPLSPLETWRANTEALERAPETGEGIGDARRRGRIEVETRRVSDEVTRQAQKRIRESASQRSEQRQSPTSAAGGPTTRPESAGESSLKEASPYRTTPSASRHPLPDPWRIHNILAPLDGTVYAQRALPYVKAAARMTGSAVTLAHVALPAIPASARAAKLLVEQIITGAHESQADNMPEYLEAQRAQVTDYAPTARTVTLEASSVIAGLKQLAEREQSNLVILATHAREGFERQALGNTAEELVERSHLPLLIVPPQVVVPTESPTITRVLVSLDGSEVAEQALGLLLGLIQASTESVAKRGENTPWEVTLFTVVENEVLTADARAYLADVEARLSAHPVWKQASISVSSLVLVGSAPGAIVDIADHGPHAREEHGAPFDMVVMATHGHGGLGRLLLGSVAAYVLQHATVPMLLVHPTDVTM